MPMRASGRNLGQQKSFARQRKRPNSAVPLPLPGTGAMNRQRPSAVLQDYVVREAQWTTRVVRTSPGSKHCGSVVDPAADAVDANVFMSHEWLHAWWTAIGPTRSSQWSSPRTAATCAHRSPDDRAREERRPGGTGPALHRGWDRRDGYINLLVARSARAPALQTLLAAIATLDWTLRVQPDPGSLDQHQRGVAMDRRAWPAGRRDVEPLPGGSPASTVDR